MPRNSFSTKSATASRTSRSRTARPTRSRSRCSPGSTTRCTRAEDAGEAEVGALLITGAPGMFSGGFDLAGHAQRAGGGGQARHRRRRALHAHVRLADAGRRGVHRSRDRGGRAAAARRRRAHRRARRVPHRAHRDRSSAWCCRGGRSSSRRSDCRSATSRTPPSAPRIYDPDGAVDAGFLDSVVAARSARRGGRGRGRSGGPSFPRDAYRGQVRMCRGERARPARRGDRRRPGPGVRGARAS